MRFQGTVYRVTPLYHPHYHYEAHPLDYGEMIDTGGRWYRPGRGMCLYTSLEKDTCLREWGKQLRRMGNHRVERAACYEIEVTVDPVYDLTRSENRTARGLTLRHVTGDDPDSLERCKEAGVRLHQREGFPAIRVPSAAGDRVEEGENLVIYGHTGRAVEYDLSYRGNFELITEAKLTGRGISIT